MTAEGKKFRKMIEAGLEKSYQKLLEYKRQKNSVMVVLQGDIIVKYKP
jgi:hypothetical protein